MSIPQLNPISFGIKRTPLSTLMTHLPITLLYAQIRPQTPLLPLHSPSLSVYLPIDTFVTSQAAAAMSAVSTHHTTAQALPLPNAPSISLPSGPSSSAAIIARIPSAVSVSERHPRLRARTTTTSSRASKTRMTRHGRVSKLHAALVEASGSGDECRAV